MGGVAWTDFQEAIDALEEARVGDFVRYVGRQMREHRGLDQMPFGQAWPLLIGGYTSQAMRIGGSRGE